MTQKINFTQDRIINLALPTVNKDRGDYYDTGCPKLMCRVTQAGVKSFVVNKKTSDGKFKRITLGRFPDISVSEARKMAQAVLTDLAQGINPTEEKRKMKLKGITLAELMTNYLDQKKDKLKASTAEDYQEKLEQGFSDWLNKPVTEITRDMVATRHKTLGGNATTKDNKMRVLRLLMRYALALKIIDESPTDALKDIGLWSKPTRRNRIIPSEKLAEWYNAVLSLPNKKAKVYLLMLLYTGIRADEAITLKWADVDFADDAITFRDTKNKSDFTTYIPKALKPYLRELQGLTGKTPFAFASSSTDGCMDIPRKPIMQIIKNTGIEFSSHDLRRTFSTIAEVVLLPESIIKRLLNHTTDNNVTTGYIRTEADTLRQAVERIAGYIAAKIEPDSQNVTQFRESLGKQP